VDGRKEKNIMIRQTIQKILEEHKLWLEHKGGKRAVLRNVDLHGADLHGAILIDADLRECNLMYANLRDANLRRIDLRDVNLQEASLRHANLQHVTLYRVNLYAANLQHANLTEAFLKDVVLTNAKLRYANLNNALVRDTDLYSAIWDHTTIGIHEAPEGDLIGWGMKSGHIVKMLIPADAPRSCSTGRKCRAAWVRVLEIDDGAIDGFEHLWEDDYDQYCVIYKVGEIVRVSGWEKNRWRECAPGIHFFLTRHEAEI